MSSNKVIKKLRGLGIVSRIIIALFSSICGVGLIITEYNSARLIGAYSIGIFCITIALVCITRGRIQKFFGSLIGSVVFTASMMYLFSELKAGQILSKNASEPSVVNALLFFIVFGIPGISYTAYAKFGIKKKEEKTVNRYKKIERSQKW